MIDEYINQLEKMEECMSDMEATDMKMASEALSTLISFVNKFGCPDKLFAQLLMREHRTLQQSTMRLFMTCIDEWSRQEDYDLRNEATITLSRKIMETFKDKNYLPFI